MKKNGTIIAVILSIVSKKLIARMFERACS